MMAANVIDKSELPDFDEETGLLHKVGAFPGLSHFVRKLLKSPPPDARVGNSCNNIPHRKDLRTNDFNKIKTVILHFNLQDLNLLKFLFV